jgi:hypothetical protein
VDLKNGLLVYVDSNSDRYVFITYMRSDMFIVLILNEVNMKYAIHNKKIKALSIIFIVLRSYAISK